MILTITPRIKGEGLTSFSSTYCWEFGERSERQWIKRQEP